MRRRYLLSASSVSATPGDGVYLASRGCVSTSWRPGRDFVGVVIARVSTLADGTHVNGDGNIVEVETTFEWEDGCDKQVQRRPFDGTTEPRGPLDLDALREMERARATQRPVTVTSSMLPWTIIDMQRHAAAPAVGTVVYTADGSTVSTSQPPNGARVGVVVGTQPDGSVLVQVGGATTAADVATALQRHDDGDMAVMPRVLATTPRSGLVVPVFRATSMQFATGGVVNAIDYSGVDLGEVRGASPLPLGRTQGTYRAVGAVDFSAATGVFRQSLTRASDAVRGLAAAATSFGGVATSMMREVARAAQQREVAMVREMFEESRPRGVIPVPRFDVVAMPGPESYRPSGTFSNCFRSASSLTAANLERVVDAMSSAPIQLSSDYATRPVPVPAEIRATASQPTLYHIDAVEVAPSAAQWLPRLTPMLSHDVALDGDEVRGIGAELAATVHLHRHHLYYVPSRRALRVASELDLAEATDASSWLRLAV